MHGHVGATLNVSAKRACLVREHNAVQEHTRSWTTLPLLLHKVPRVSKVDRLVERLAWVATIILPSPVTVSGQTETCCGIQHASKPLGESEILRPGGIQAYMLPCAATET